MSKAENHETKADSILDEQKKHILLDEYYSAEIIEPPKQLSPLFVTADHSPWSLKYMGMAYDFLTGEFYEGRFNPERMDIQIFEIPNILDNCEGYAELGYIKKEEYFEIEAKETFPIGEPGWIKLDSKTDFSCRKGFEKIFVYSWGWIQSTHWTRQWGDGSILSKQGAPSIAGKPTQVVRAFSPNHPVIEQVMNKIEAIWIKKYNQEVPAPFFRWQSISPLSKMNKPLQEQEGEPTLTSYYYEALKIQSVLKKIPLKFSVYHASFLKGALDFLFAQLSHPSFKKVTSQETSTKELEEIASNSPSPFLNKSLNIYISMNVANILSRYGSLFFKCKTTEKVGVFLGRDDAVPLMQTSKSAFLGARAEYETSVMKIK